jgi:anti-sigma factor RsiW
MMHDSALHLTEDELHDAADGTQAPAEAGRAARHLTHCARCRTDVDRIRELLALAASLPRAIDPPADLWPDIRTRIRQQPGAMANRKATSRSRWDSFFGDRRWLAAAAVLLIVASSALTAVLLGPRTNDLARAPDSIGPVAGPQGAPIVRTVSDEYDRLDQELAALLAAQRGKMQPETIAKVERNLAIIDAAIAEIRQALAADPGNDALRQLLKASYGQKSALVRQVSTS